MSNYVVVEGTDKVLRVEVVTEDDLVFCDNCADPYLAYDLYHYDELPCEIESANKGESGSLCETCNAGIQSRLAFISYAKHYTNLMIDSDTPYL